MRLFRTYVLPGFVFQSVLVGGGYATGRELVEFFFASGPLGGILGLLVSGLIFGLVLAIGFEFARVNVAYDYRTFCRALLGRGWIIFEVALLVLGMLVLSVLASAASELAGESFGWPPYLGTIVLMALIALLTFYGSELIQNVLAGWSILLYLVYIALFVLAYLNFGDTISSVYASATVDGSWVTGGILYTGYNLAILPTILFAVQGLKQRRETIGSGLIAGALAVVPAILFYVAMMGLYPDIGAEAVPVVALMTALDTPYFSLLFQLVIFGTFVETGTALLHAVNERVGQNFKETGKELPRYARPLIATSAIVVAVVAGTYLGIIDLIAKGYSALTLVFIAILVVPLLTIGFWRCFVRSAD